MNIAEYYKYRIFPRIMDSGIRVPEVFQLRKQLLSDASGRILEIGYGTGESLKFYPTHVKSITAIEPNTGMRNFDANQTDINVELLEMVVEELNFPDETFDCVVSMFTLCSVNDLEKALDEIKRVLKKDGAFLFLEHGMEQKKLIALFQRLFNPVQKILGVGCDLTRNFHDSILKAGFKIENFRNARIKKVSPLYNYFYFGKAYKIQQQPKGKGLNKWGNSVNNSQVINSFTCKGSNGN